MVCAKIISQLHIRGGGGYLPPLWWINVISNNRSHQAKNQNNRNNQSEQRGLWQVPNENSKWKQSNRPKRGKMPFNISQFLLVLLLIGWEGRVSFLNQLHLKNCCVTFKYAVNYCSFFNILTLERRHWGAGLSCKSTSCKGE